ncbi:RsmB/NOP family class I SAM-dependent RNA methyltransferase [Rubellimicrobium sp. CFH 75288]|uniref:RsmB/NOP family class I SAM-dependent RNA methyltransferase n=1 Tax=Rubellimicrobium sp. CFH 75288 TaxID=2697034 RepID=UPI0014129030|nr:RsmB/NOP family class I SAM-dependent RNA methyltransferase [Rubellimicrobium sp. CFH 75288]
MTPAARVAAAAGLLDRILAGEPAEQVLTGWGRRSRFAGSGDRAAVRDLVFDALRRRRSAAWAGGGETGRALLLGLARLDGTDPATIFTGGRHALAPLSADEGGRALAEAPRAVRLDLPDWLLPLWDAALGPDADRAAEVQRHRAPVTLRVDLSRLTREEAARRLAAEGVDTIPDPRVPTALRALGRAPRITATAPYRDGLVELQDASSQEAVLRLPLRDGDRVLDLCAGGGGKTLAMGARARLELVAHDIDPRRMADLPARAERAGLAVRRVRDPASGAPFDLVLVDAPCTGSGTWRRNPDARWRLTRADLDRLTAVQDSLLGQAARLVRPGGALAFATCSVLEEEGDARIRPLLAGGCWTLADRFRVVPDADRDGFYQAVLRHRGHAS